MFSKCTIKEQQSTSFEPFPKFECIDMSKTGTVVVEETKSLPASVSKKPASTVSEIFESLSYGPAPESSMPAEGWLDDHGRAFGHFIDGKWVKPEGRKVYETKNPVTGLVVRPFNSFWFSYDTCQAISI